MSVENNSLRSFVDHVSDKVQLPQNIELEHTVQMSGTASEWNSSNGLTTRQVHADF